MYDDFFCEKSPDKRRQIFLENGVPSKLVPVAIELFSLCHPIATAKDFSVPYSALICFFSRALASSFVIIFTLHFCMRGDPRSAADTS